MTIVGSPSKRSPGRSLASASAAGFVPGAGAGILLIESEESALARGARIYASIAGIAEHTFSEHPTRISQQFAVSIMGHALKQARISINDIGWINAHATSTVQGDAVEACAIAALSK